MSHQTLLTVYVVLFIIVFAAFGMQRATLLISRESGLPLKQLATLLLPSWFPFIWLPRIAKWVVLVLIGFYWSWWVALEVLGADLLLSSILPIPYTIHARSFRKRVERMRLVDPDAAASLEGILAGSRLYKF